MSPELARALTCYREWLEIMENAKQRCYAMVEAQGTLTTEDVAAYKILAERIRTEHDTNQEGREGR